MRQKITLGKTIDELKVGDQAELSKTISQTDIYLYTGVTGDLNPLYLDEAYAGKTHFKGTIAPGILIAGLINAVLATKLPGAGTVSVHEKFEFLKPVRKGDTITTTLTITEINRERKRVKILATSRNQAGELCVKAELLVIPPEKPFSALEALWQGYS